MTLATGPKISSRELRMALVGFGQQGRAEVKARCLAVEPFTAEGERSAFPDADGDVILVLLQLGRIDDRTDLGLGIERIADHQLAQAVLEGVDEAVMDAFRHDQPGRSGAALAGREEGAVIAHSTAVPRSASSSTDERILAAHLELELAHVLDACGGSTRLPVPTEPVKLMALTSGLSSIAWPTTEPLPMTRLSTPLGRPARCRMSTIDQALSGTSSAGLKTMVLPWASAGAIFQAGMAIGKFQGVMANHADRLPRDLDADAGPHTRHDFPRKAQCFAREEIEYLGGANGLADSLGQGLAFLARQIAADLILARMISSEAFFSTAWRPADRSGTRRKRRLGRRDRLLRLLGSRRGIFADHVARVRGIDVARTGVADPFAIDEVLSNRVMVWSFLGWPTRGRISDSVFDRQIASGKAYSEPVAAAKIPNAGNIALRRHSIRQ